MTSLAALMATLAFGAAIFGIAAGTLHDAIVHLDHLVDLGINTVHLMPEHDQKARHRSTRRASFVS